MGGFEGRGSRESNVSETQKFKGLIGRDWRDSEPWWPTPPRPPDDAPNVMLIVLDDVGFAQLGCYGSDIATPHIDQLAAGGVRLANFHTTALCSPTRSCLLTGRNHHRNGMGRVADLAMGYPGYSGVVPKENGFLSEILRAEGYATYAVGKWHLSPDDETSMAAPRWTWPIGRGFDRWYGFHGGETHQFVPSLYQDNHSIQPPRSIKEGYHLSADLADQAIGQIGDLRAVDSDQPFFLYFGTGACHSPHHAPREWIERYRGQFDGGWDQWREATYARQLEEGIIPPGTELAPRPPWVTPWDDVPPEDQRVAARFMECFAAFLSYTDAQIGRVLDFLAENGDLDNTLVMLVSDNGASSEGGPNGSINDGRLWNYDPAPPEELRDRIDELGTPTAHNNYPWGWTMAGNTPFKRWKREVHEGGVADPCIVQWPSRLGEAGGGIRHQFTHAIDVVPTVLELIGVEAPDTIEYVPQSPIDGTSFAYALGPDGAAAAERHQTQHFEMLGSRAIYHQGWKAVTFKSIGPVYNGISNYDTPFDDDAWELYHVAEDPSEVHDLAAAHPDRLAALVELWWSEAAQNQVLPLDNRIIHTVLNPKPDRRRPRDTYTYFPSGSPVPEAVAANVRNRSHQIVAQATMPERGVVQGVLLAFGSALGGFSFHVTNGRLRYVHNLYGRERHVVTSLAPLAPGPHQLAFQYESTGAGGVGTLLIDGDIVGTGPIAQFTPARFNVHGAGLSCGYELGPAVGTGYEAPFPFTGELHSVTVTLGLAPPPVDPMAQFDAIMAEQ
jgi:arylsulfatase A-like enzyme